MFHNVLLLNPSYQHRRAKERNFS